MTAPYYTDTSVTLWHGDCLDVLRTLPDASVDAVVTDPPYGLEFMGKGWDAPWEQADVNADAGFHGGGISATRNLPSFTGSTNPKCIVCKGTRRGRRDGTAKVAVCLCEDGGRFPNVRAVEMRAFQDWCEQWATECLRILKPGGHLLAFGGSRTWHRLAAAVEDAGFEIRDSIAWLYGSGFPKSLNVERSIDTALCSLPGRHRWTPQACIAAGDHVCPSTSEGRAHDGDGTALKPSFEPIVVGRKPLAGTVAANVLAHGTGALNIDACRVGDEPREVFASTGEVVSGNSSMAGPNTGRVATGRVATGRWPTNVVLDGDQAAELDRQTGVTRSRVGKPRGAGSGAGWGMTATGAEYDDQGGASRFFPVFRYEAKAPTSERPRGGEAMHPTVKPLDLMRWLVRLVTPPGGVVLEPFAGSGTTAEACVVEGFRCIAIEREADYLPLIVQRLHRRDVTAPATVEVVPGAMQDGFDFGEVSA